MFSSSHQAPVTSSSEGVVFFDVRSPAEFSTGHVAGAHNLPLDRFVDGYRSLAPDTAQQIVIYCASGARSAQAVQYMQQLGYRNVVNGISAQSVCRQYMLFSM